eukprot:889224-Pyramimonas_sp.AAC.1
MFLEGFIRRLSLLCRIDGASAGPQCLSRQGSPHVASGVPLQGDRMPKSSQTADADPLAVRGRSFFSCLCMAIAGRRVASVS